MVAPNGDRGGRCSRGAFVETFCYTSKVVPVEPTAAALARQAHLELSVQTRSPDHETMRLSPLLLCLMVAFWTIGTATAEAQLSSSSRYENPKADSLLSKAIAQENSGTLKEAIRVYRELHQLRPNDPRPTNSIAGLYGKLRQPTRQLQWAQRAIEQDGSFFQAYINAGNALTAMRKDGRAEKKFRRAVRLQPNSPLGYYSLGVLAERQRKLEQAIKYYEQSVSVDPEFENGFFNLGAMYANAGRFDKAVEALRRVIELDPDAQDARAMLRKIETREK